MPLTAAHRVLLWLSHPALLAHRIRAWVWERRHPDKPWLCPGTIGFCERHLHRAMRVLEFGSGRSTPWLAALVGELTSVEHDRAWYERIHARLTRDDLNVDYRLVPLDHPPSEPEHPEYAPLPAYVTVVDRFADGSLDFVFVDGHYRTHCVRRVVPKVRAGGYLLVDDVNLWPTLGAIPVPPAWRIADDSTNGLKRCVIWQAP